MKTEGSREGGTDHGRRIQDTRTPGKKQPGEFLARRRKRRTLLALPTPLPLV